MKLIVEESQFEEVVGEREACICAKVCINYYSSSREETRVLPPFSFLKVLQLWCQLVARWFRITCRYPRNVSVHATLVSP